MKKLIHWMYDNNLFIKYGIMYDTIYVYSKQYRCAKAMCLSSTLEFTHRVIIDRCINAPGHGRSKMYGIHGAKKTYLKQNFAL